MREIKFREAYFDKGRFIGFMNHYFGENPYSKKSWIQFGIHWIPDEDVSFGDLQQYTGLKDKNGKEIYEGDIVKFAVSEWKDNQDINEIMWSNRKGGWNINSILSPTSEVIGNIYQNSELINN